MLSFNDFIHKYGLKNKAKSIIKNQNNLSFLCLSDVGAFLMDGPFKASKGIVTLHPTKGTHWVACINENYFDS